MSPNNQPPERHFGFECIKCRSANFMGRRYACWICIGYQICGTCYDSDTLPLTPEHKRFHPLEVHYTRAEYELYFSGEIYSESNVPQSYKCAFCRSCGFTSLQLYKHVTESHRGHKDFNEYHSILHTRYTAESSPGTAESASPAAAATAPPLSSRRAARSPFFDLLIDRNENGIGQSENLFHDGHRLSTDRQNAESSPGTAESASPAAAATAPPLSSRRAGPSPFHHPTQTLRQWENHFRDGHRLLTDRQNAIIEEQQRRLIHFRARQLDEFNMRLREVRLVDGNLVYVRPANRSSKSNRVWFSGSRLGGAQSGQRLKEDDMNPYWAASLGGHGKRNRSDRKQSTSYADVARQSVENLFVKDAPKKPESSQFLCDRFRPKEKEQNKMLPHYEVRGRFTEALICSMLSEEHLTPMIVKTVVVGENVKPEDKLVEALSAELATLSKPSDDAMDRFYRGLDNYSKWLADFTKAKNSKEDDISPLPNMLAREVEVAILTIDSDVDNDTDDDNGEASDGNELVTIEIADDDDDDEDGDDAEENAEEDAEEDGDEDGDDNGDGDEGGDDDGTGSETSESTIAMIVNQVYGSA